MKPGDHPVDVRDVKGRQPNSRAQFRSAGIRQGRKQEGYTLIELMIVLIVLSILASIAVPQYFEYVRDSRRTDATTSMNRILSQQELFYSNNQSTYTGSVTDLGYDEAGSYNTTLSEEDFYTIQILDCDGAAPGTGTSGGISDCIALTATPASGSSQAKDNECNSFTLNSLGRQTASSDHCWD